MTEMTVAVVHLGRPQAMGEVRRLASWKAIVEAAGGRTIPVNLLADHRASPTRVPGLLAVAHLAAVPETLAWCARSATAALTALQPDVVVSITARAFHPVLGRGRWATVVDYVDRLSLSYRDRAGISESLPRSLGFRILAAAASRFEGRGVPTGIRPVAAGWTDARALGAEWLPNVVELDEPPDPALADHDLLFVGNLAYPPNVAAVARLGDIWPSVLEARPGTTLLLAGSTPSPRVLRLAGRHCWSVVADFTLVRDVCARARVAVAPLDHTAGIQNKVLDAAANGLAQVVSPAALAGMRPGFPATVARTDREFVSAVVRLLVDPGLRGEQIRAARGHLREHYVATRWAGWAGSLCAHAAERSGP